MSIDRSSIGTMLTFTARRKESNDDALTAFRANLDKIGRKEDLAFAVGQFRTSVVHTGLWDKLCDLFRSVKKSELLTKTVQLIVIHEAKKRGIEEDAVLGALNVRGCPSSARVTAEALGWLMEKVTGNGLQWDGWLPAPDSGGSIHANPNDASGAIRLPESVPLLGGRWFVCEGLARPMPDTASVDGKQPVSDENSEVQSENPELDPSSFGEEAEVIARAFENAATGLNAVGEKSMAARASRHAAEAYAAVGDWARCEASHRYAVLKFEEAGDSNSVAEVLDEMALIAYGNGQNGVASVAYTAAAEALAYLGRNEDAAQAYLKAARIDALAGGRLGQARVNYDCCMKQYLLAGQRERSESVRSEAVTRCRQKSGVTDVGAAV